MALNEYQYNGGTYQFDDDDAPKGAKCLDAKSAEKKAAKPANKARTPQNKAAKPAEKKADPAVDAASDPGASE